MSLPRCLHARTFLTAIAALVVTTGAGLEVWGAADRAAAGGQASRSHVDPSLSARAADAREHPTAAAYASLARGQAAAGLPADAAASALTASRLDPVNPQLASVAEGYVDAAVRDHVRRSVRPFAIGSAILLALSFLGAARLRRREQHRDAVLARARGRLVLSVEGDGEARGDTATLWPGASALVIDVHGDSTLASLREPPPLVVALSHGEAGRTVRLSPRKDAAGGAARFRVTGASLDELLAHPGRWRILVRAGGALLAEGSVRCATRANGKAA